MKSSSRARRCGERQLAQILVAVGKQIVGAQMRGKFGHELLRDAFAIEPLLQHVERLHAAVAHDQKLAVDRAGQTQRIEEIGKALGNILAGARIEPRDLAAVAARGDGLHADAVPFPFGHELGRIERGEIGVVERMRQHRRPERRRIAARRFVGAAFEPGEQLDVGRRRPGQSSSMSCASVAPSAATAALASRADTPMRKPPVTSLISAQRPVSSSASSQRASCAGSSALPSVERVSMTAVRDNSPPPCGERLGVGVEWSCAGVDGDASPPDPLLPSPTRGER